ncbi:hypothetical protein WN55_06269 [Dufourea novaeangliae]|uniref:CCHC-type domain-containing protein n=1 Tax=Dufourea novaeangliae TaxID=178035 RepID=A0A154PQL4_DUFNO|nr:hypothetical protein WN55_06269 [Dufourea novaeangliae]
MLAIPASAGCVMADQLGGEAGSGFRSEGGGLAEAKRKLLKLTHKVQGLREEDIEDRAVPPPPGSKSCVRLPPGEAVAEEMRRAPTPDLGAKKRRKRRKKPPAPAVVGPPAPPPARPRTGVLGDAPTGLDHPDRWSEVVGRRERRKKSRARPRGGRRHQDSPGGGGVAPRACRRGQRSPSPWTRAARRRIPTSCVGLWSGSNWRTSGLPTSATGRVRRDPPFWRSPESAAKADALAARLAEVFHGTDVRVSRPARTVEMRLTGLDESVTAEAVAAAVARVGGCAAAEVRSGEIRRNWVRCPLTAAGRLTTAGLILVGWSSATVEALPARPLRCYHCQEEGHVRQKYTRDADRGGRCYSCGGEGRMVRDCAAAPKCPVCADLGRPANHSVGPTRPTLVLGDFNAKSTLWGGPRTDARGDAVEEWAASADLRLLNRGSYEVRMRTNTRCLSDELCYRNPVWSLWVKGWLLMHGDTRAGRVSSRYVAWARTPMELMFHQHPVEFARPVRGISAKLGARPAQSPLTAPPRGVPGSPPQ